MKGTMAKLNKRKTMTSPRAKRGVGKRFYDFFSLVENLPYGASLLHEKKVARVAMGVGVLVMAAGAAIFSIGWKFHVTWLVETAFVITLIGWMMVILGFAFGVVGWAAKYVPITRPKAGRSSR
jgi:hypothetical protein